MNYELAKKLKDAGFSQCEEETQISCHANGCWREGSTYGYSNAHNPTLYELIRACGDRFFRLEPYFAISKQHQSWTASGVKEFNDLQTIDIILTKGQTPDEAVANLWLKLYEKTPKTTK